MNDVARISARPVIRKAERRKARLRLALCGPTGSGKTYSALQLAFGLGTKIGVIDTEHASADLYAHLGDYDVITLEPPYTVGKYRDAIVALEDAGYDVIIVDSLSHAWSGEGGLLDKQSQLENSGRYKNSFATWRERNTTSWSSRCSAARRTSSPPCGPRPSTSWRKTTAARTRCGN